MNTTTVLSASLAWAPLPALPDREGFAGSFAGVSGGALLVAGGANFPDKRPWEGGAKVWYDRVFALTPGAMAWSDAGHLPCLNGYGVSISVPEGLVLIGGGDAKRNFAVVLLAHWAGHAVSFSTWPVLPKPLAQAAGACVGRTIYVAGGLDRPDATQAQRACYALDLDGLDHGWREVPPCPGPERFLATASAHDGAFYLFGGARLVSDAQGKVQREWLRDAWRYTPSAGWKRLADLPRAAVAAPTPAPAADGKLLIIGGDDGTQASVGPTEHRGFPRDVLGYDIASDSWTRIGDVPFSLVTTTATNWRGRIIIPGGEARPGVRSPAVWAAAVREIDPK
jgi:N-acetylneuraminic acid mutarotase